MYVTNGTLDAMRTTMPKRNPMRNGASDCDRECSERWWQAFAEILKSKIHNTNEAAEPVLYSERTLEQRRMQVDGENRFLLPKHFSILDGYVSATHANERKRKFVSDVATAEDDTNSAHSNNPPEFRINEMSKQMTSEKWKSMCTMPETKSLDWNKEKNYLFATSSCVSVHWLDAITNHERFGWVWVRQ